VPRRESRSSAGVGEVASPALDFLLEVRPRRELLETVVRLEERVVGVGEWAVVVEVPGVVAALQEALGVENGGGEDADGRRGRWTADDVVEVEEEC
jgi:hypothetical protein